MAEWIYQLCLVVFAVIFAFVLKFNGNKKVKKKDCEKYRKESDTKLDQVVESIAKVEGYLDGIYNRKTKK